MMECLKQKNIKKIFFFFLSFLLVIALAYIGFFDLAQEKVYDGLMGEEEPLNAIVIVAIDDNALAEIGQFPWERRTYIPYLEHMDEAKVIGVDILFAEQTSQDQELIESLPQQSVLAMRLTQGKAIVPFEGKYDNIGYINVITDADGITRRAHLNADSQYQSFTQKIYEEYFTKKLQITGIQRIHFVGEPNSFETISLTQTINKPKEYFKNKIILIGVTAPDLHDTFFVPTSRGTAMPGVEIHANLLNTLIKENPYIKNTMMVQMLILLVITILMCFVLTKSNILNIMIIVGSFIIYEIIVIVAYSYNYLLDIAYVPILLVLIYMTDVLIKYFQEKVEKKGIIKAFSKYVSPDVLEDMIQKGKQPKIGGEKREIAIMFSDIRGFTTFAEKTSPQKLVEILNKQLNMLTKIILNKKGLVDKYIGDCIMAFWGAPLLNKNKEQDASETAIQMILAMEQNQGEKQLKIGIGIHTGDAIVGNMGGEDRFDYTAIGDTVNTASRLESLTKQYNVDIIISEEVKKKIKNVQTKLLDHVRVKGKKKPMKIYELIATKREGKDIQYFEQALNYYFKGEWKKALEILSKTKDPSKEMLKKRIKGLQVRKVKNWDGIYTHEKK